MGSEAPCSMRVWIEVKPGAEPSRRITLECGIPALSAAANATGKALGRVIRILDFAVLRAWVISSTM